MSDMTELAGLWIGESKKGTKYMSGRLTDEALDALNAADGAGKLMVYRNETKKSDKAPDYRLMFAPDDDARPAPKPRGGGDRTRPDAPPPEDDEIPF
jgi:uncharacterized protein (DUF736 family)